MQVYVARQPIFNKKKEIYGYELLFRGGMSNFFPDIDGGTATSTLLSNSFFTIGIEELTGSRPAFVNFTQDLLLHQVPLMFPSETVVIEILEDVEPTEDLIDACKHFGEKGYYIALDDFVYRPDLEPLMALADIIKIDFRETSFEKVADCVKKSSGYNVKLLAEKVETNEEFWKALEMGFDYFQGYFFSKPEIIGGKDISSAQMGLLQVMAEANKEDFEFREVEAVILRDVSISYKLLRYINSVYFGIIQDISSINQALVLLGENGTKRFLSLIAMAKLASDKPDELIRASIVRARFCESLGNISHSDIDRSGLFTLGLFSKIDAILDDSMENLMKKLPLSNSIKDALIYGEGELKDYLRLAACYEVGDWGGVSDSAGVLSLKEEEIPPCFTGALNWADNFTTGTSAVSN